MSNNQTQAFQFAAKLVKIRKRSVFELAKRLEKKGFEDGAINKVIEDFKKYKYLDDEKFAESYIIDRINFNPRGKDLIKKELRDKGVDEEIIDGKTNELLNEEKETELAEKLAEKKLKAVSKNLDKEEVYGKLGRYLRSKGFSSFVIENVLNKVIKEMG